MSQAHAERHDDREADQRQPPRQAERPHERERRQRGKRRLDGQDRKLRGDQRRHLRTDLGGRAAQCGDPRGDPQVPVEQAAQDLHARRAIEDAARDRPAGRLDGQVPRLAASEQRDDLQQHGDGEHPQRGAGQRIRELFAVPREREHEDRRGDQRAHDRDRGAMATDRRREGDRRRSGSAHPGSPSRRRYRLVS